VGKSEGMALSLQWFRIYKKILGGGACTGQVESKSNTLQMAFSKIHGYFLPCDVCMGLLCIGVMRIQRWNYYALNQEF